MFAAFSHIVVFFPITKGHFTLSCNDYGFVEEMYYISFTRGLPSEQFVQLMITFH